MAFDFNSAKPISPQSVGNTEAAQQAVVQNTQPVNTKSRATFDPSTAKAISTMRELSTFDPVGKMKAFGTGAANATADVLTGIADMPTFIMSQVPGLNKIINKEFADKSYAENKKAFDIIRPDISQQAKQQNPISYGAGYIVPSLLGNVGAYTALEKATRLPAVAGEAAPASLQFLQQLPSQMMAAGLSNTMNQSTQAGKESAFNFGSAVVPIVNLAGTMISSLGKAGESKQILKQAVGDIKTQWKQQGFNNADDAAAYTISKVGQEAYKINDNNYQVIKSIPGTIDNKSILNNIQNMLNTNFTGNKLSKNMDWTTGVTSSIPPQITVLKSAAEQASNLKNMDEALNLRSYISSNRDLFQGKGVSKEVMTAYRSLQQNVDNAIAYKANEAGLGNVLKQANGFWENTIKPLEDFGTKDIMQAVAQKDKNPSQYADTVAGIVSRAKKSPQALRAFLDATGEDGNKIIQQSIVKNIFGNIIPNYDSFDQHKALKTLNRSIDEYSNVLSKDSIDVLKGIKQTMISLGVKDQSVKHYIGTMMIGGSLGTGLGGAVGGVPGAMIGGAAGMSAAVATQNTINQLLESDTGVFILRGVGSKAPWANRARDAIINTIRSTSGEVAKNLVHPEQDNQQPPNINTSSNPKSIQLALNDEQSLLPPSIRIPTHIKTQPTNNNNNPQVPPNLLA